jgi:hypothetical protein
VAPAESLAALERALAELPATQAADAPMLFEPAA